MQEKFCYVLLFKYAGNWHIDVFYRDSQFKQESSSDIEWLKEAANFAIERQNILKPNTKLIAEVQIFTLQCFASKDNEEGYVRLDSVPVHAIYDVKITKI